MRYIILICASVVASMSTAHAEKPFGMLTCTFIKSAQDATHKMTCGFKPAGIGAEEKYSGIILASSEDLLSGKIVLIWTVLGPVKEKVQSGVLAQRYANATNAPGQTPMLVGETDSGIALQFETNNGAAAYETITEMELQLTGTAA